MDHYDLIYGSLDSTNYVTPTSNSSTTFTSKPVLTSAQAQLDKPTTLLTSTLTQGGSSNVVNTSTSNGGVVIAQ